MRVLVGCEFSGIVRDAFLAFGHEAYSCDLLPTESPSPFHLQCDLLEVLDAGWDLGVFHPPCTYLAVSGARWLHSQPDRIVHQCEAVEFVRTLMAAPIPRIAIENPIGVLSTLIRKPDQIVHPWQFGHGEVKSTCLWLKGLPLLQPTVIDPGRDPKVHHAAPHPDRWKDRARTYPGIALAMAEQWGVA